MTDFVVERVAEAKALLLARAERLKKLLDNSRNTVVSEEFVKGAEIVQQLIENETELLDQMVFKEPTNNLELLSNLRLATGDMNQTVAEGMKKTTDAIDGMLDALESLGKSR